MTGSNSAPIVPPPVPMTITQIAVVVADIESALRSYTSGRVGESIEFCYLDTSPLLKFVLESGSGHAIDLEPTYVFP